METKLIAKVRRPRIDEPHFATLVCKCERQANEAADYLETCGIECMPLSKAEEQWGCSGKNGYVYHFTDEHPGVFYDTAEELGFAREAGELGLYEALVELGVSENRADEIADVIYAGRRSDAIKALAKEGLAGQYIDYQGYPVVAYGVFLL